MEWKGDPGSLFRVDLTLVFRAEDYEDAGEAAEEVAQEFEKQLLPDTEVRIEKIERVTW